MTYMHKSKQKQVTKQNDKLQLTQYIILLFYVAGWVIMTSMSPVNLKIHIAGLFMLSRWLTMACYNLFMFFSVLLF